MMLSFQLVGLGTQALLSTSAVGRDGFLIELVHSF